MIRIFDHNVWCNKLIANRNTLIRRMISHYDADVCTLQECRPSTHRVGDTDLGALLADTYAEVCPELFDRNHTPIFYRRARFDVIDSGYELFEGLNNIGSKSITWAVLYDKLEDSRFAVLSTHFWYMGDEEGNRQRVENVHQVKRCCDRIVEKYNVPVILAGDLNCIPNSDPYREMETVGFADVRKCAAKTTDRHTHHALPEFNEEKGVFECNAPLVKTIDYAFAYAADAIELHSFNVLTEQMAMDSSDHCPLLVEFDMKKERDLFVNFAHRGASEYMAENTLSSFYRGLRMGANGIETDVQITKDGVLVLFHDDTLARVTACEGEVKDYTYDELCRMRVRNAKTGEEDIIVRFEDFLRYFGWRELTFAIEIKKSGYEKEVVDMLERFEMRDKTVITSFKFPCIEAVKAYRPDYKVGYLIKDLDDEKYENMKRIGCEQICPQAKCVTAEKVLAWRALGFSVRAWGVSNEEIMKATADAGVDGMTVNFPDLLTKYRKQ
ncbi:MAG: endonuclease/exonuclease/phosphatase family protein [Clostridia bacterium]|nr:endonuclease/exonuclease/phosphatase family protein [Clostridia bacterium]